LSEARQALQQAAAKASDLPRMSCSTQLSIKLPLSLRAFLSAQAGTHSASYTSIQWKTGFSVTASIFALPPPYRLKREAIIPHLPARFQGNLGEKQLVFWLRFSRHPIASKPQKASFLLKNRKEAF